MNVCTGAYLNLFSDTLHIDKTDLADDNLDIFIVFAEWFDDDITEAEERARAAIERWKGSYYPRVSPDNPNANRSIGHKIKRVLEREFEDEAIFIHVTAEQEAGRFAYNEEED